MESDLPAIKAAIDAGTWGKIPERTRSSTALLAAVPTLWKIRNDSKTAAQETRPNHGSSMRDAVTRIEATMQGVSEMQKSQGHQLGEIKRNSIEAHGLIAQLLKEHAERLKKLEQK